LGDSIHCVKPYFGLGVNSAFEDVAVLNTCFDDVGKSTGDGGVGDDKNAEWQSALPLFSQRRAADSKALVDISRGFDGGFLTFVLPLILDGVFHKAFPKLFSPNTIAMLQKEDWTFSRIQRRKRTERVAQAGILAAVFSGVVWVLVRAAVAVAAKIATLAV
jgi:2-polyprenyl-6-methoxyphenol hydroxylase-like FAD-dependent oxidoreductase